MAFQGYNVVLLANGYNLSPYFRQVDLALSRSTDDVTAFTNTSEAHIPVLRSGELTPTGFYDPALGASADVLYGALGSSNNAHWSFMPAGDVLTYPVYSIIGPLATYGISEELAKAVPIAAKTTAGVRPERLLNHHPLASRTATGTGTSIDNGASSPDGGAALLQVLDVSGSTPNLVVKVQDSADGSSWADILTFTAVTASNAKERLTLSGTVRRYTRAIWTISGTNPSFLFHVAFGRY